MEDYQFIKRLYLGVIEYYADENIYRTFLVSYVEPSKRVAIRSIGELHKMDADEAWTQMYNVATGIRATGNPCPIASMGFVLDYLHTVNLNKIQIMTGKEFIKHITQIGFDTENLYA